MERPDPGRVQPVDAEGLREAEDVVQREVGLAAFDAADEGPLEAGSFCEVFLGQAEFVAAFADPLPEDLRCLRDGQLRQRVGVGHAG